MRAGEAPHAEACCPWPALAELGAEDLALLDRYCRRAIGDPNAQPTAEERPAVERYEAMMDRWGRPWRQAGRARR